MLKDDGSPTLGVLVAQQVDIGIEIELLRVDPAGRVSAKPFPTTLPPALQALAQREYFEAQLEFALPQQADAVANVAQATAVVEAVAAQLAPAEQLWRYSCPPPLDQRPDNSWIARIPSASYPYRQTLSGRYDIRRLMNDGVHLNLSFAPPAMRQLAVMGGWQAADELYAHVAQQFMRHQWLLTALFGATPVSWPGYFDDGEAVHQPVRSLRSSALGFPASIHGDYRSVPHYVRRIEAALTSGTLLRAGQYYDAVRFKSATGKAPEELLRSGCSHLELRAFDLDPTAPCGVTVNQLRLVQSLAVFFALQPPLASDAVAESLADARALAEHVALEDPRQASRCQTRGLRVMQALNQFAQAHGFDRDYLGSIQHYTEALTVPEASLAFRVWQQATDPAAFR